MSGMMVSGSAVPTAARTLPTAPSPRFSLRPNHSMPLTNNSQPARITAKATMRRKNDIVGDSSRTRTAHQTRRAAPTRRPALYGAESRAPRPGQTQERAEGEDDYDREAHRREEPLAPRREHDEEGDHPREGRSEQHQQPQIDEAGRVERGEKVRQPGDGTQALHRPGAADGSEYGSDEHERYRNEQTRQQQAGHRTGHPAIGRHPGPRLLRRRSHRRLIPAAARIIWTESANSTMERTMASTDDLTLSARRDPRRAPAVTPRTTGTATVGIDHAPGEVDDRAGACSHSEHEAAGRDRRPHRDSHRQPHRRHRQEATPHAQKPGHVACHETGSQTDGQPVDPVSDRAAGPAIVVARAEPTQVRPLLGGGGRCLAARRHVDRDRDHDPAEDRAQHLLVEQRAYEAPGERPQRQSSLHAHGQPEVGQFLPYVGHGARGGGGDHGDEAGRDGGMYGHVQKERQRRDDEDTPAQADHRPERARRRSRRRPEG